MTATGNTARAPYEHLKIAAIELYILALTSASEDKRQELLELARRIESIADDCSAAQIAKTESNVVPLAVKQVTSNP